MGKNRIVLLLFGWGIFSLIAINIWNVKVVEASWKATADNDQLVSIEYRIAEYKGDTIYLEYAVTNNDAVVIGLESLDASFTISDADTGKKICCGKAEHWLHEGVEILPNYRYRNKDFIKDVRLEPVKRIAMDLQIHSFVVKRLGIPLPTGY